MGAEDSVSVSVMAAPARVGTVRCAAGQYSCDLMQLYCTQFILLVPVIPVIRRLRCAGADRPRSTGPGAMQSLGLLLAPLAMFMFVSSITPGPNNLMLLGSGIRFGFSRTIPHMLGITAGMVLLLLVSWAGVGALLLAAPGVGRLLGLLCCAYLFWLALVLLRDAAPADGASGAAARPMRFHEAVLFQFVNPKAWAMAVAACAIAEKFPLGVPARLGLMLLIGA